MQNFGISPIDSPSDCSDRFSAEDDPKRLIFWDLCYNFSTSNLGYLNPKSKNFQVPSVLFQLGFLADPLLSRVFSIRKW